MAPASMALMRGALSSCTNKHARRRAALPGTVEGRAHGIADHLLGQRARIRDHGVDAAGLGNERNDGACADPRARAGSTTPSRSSR